MVSMATLNVYPVVEVLDCNEILRPFLLFFKKKLAVLYIRATDISQTVDFFNSMVLTTIQALKCLVVSKLQFIHDN